MIVVPPPTAGTGWHHGLATLTAHLSRDLGNVVVHRTAQDTREAKAMGGTDAVRVFLA